MLEIAKALDIEAFFVPAPSRTTSAQGRADWTALGRDLAEAGRPFWDAGLSFGCHNHAFEFADIGTPEPARPDLAGGPRH